MSSYFAKKGTAATNTQFKESREPPHSIVKKVRDSIKARGAHGIRGVGRTFRRMDDNGDRKIDKQEFKWGLKDTGLKLDDKELNTLFKFFDRNNQGHIDFDEFLGALRGPMNDRRKNLVLLAYDVLDNTGDGIVDLHDIANVYKVDMHPDFISGEKTKEEILEDFMLQWDTLDRDGKVTKEEFIKY